MRLLLFLALAAGCGDTADKDTGTTDSADSAGADSDGDGFVGAEDCDESNAAVYLGAEELCNGVDDNCDGTTDEATATDATTWYPDGDGDSYGDASAGQAACTAPANTVPAGGDCADDDPAVNPGADEVCNHIDDNCDGTVDGLDAIDAPTWYADFDADGYGDRNSPVSACDAPDDTTADQTDCDDTNAEIHPGADDVCDGVDTNCDGVIDDAVPTWYADSDSDGYGDSRTAQVACEAPKSFVADGTDCDDRNNAVNPGAPEICDRYDNNCDGFADDASATDAVTWYTDGDGDTYGDPATGLASCTQPARTVADGTDCDDTNRGINPGMREYCDGIDNNCDGSLDDGTSVDATVWYLDNDNDNFGDRTVFQAACDQPRHYSEDNTDCDDTDDLIHPNAPERCNELDDDCNGAVDDGVPIGATIWYTDADGDGYGLPTSHYVTCTPPTEGYIEDGTDCDDTLDTTHPGAEDSCGDGVDSDCSGADCPFSYVGNVTALESIASVPADELSGAQVDVATDTVLYKLGAILESGGPLMEMALYTDDAGAPGSLVASTLSSVAVAGANELDTTSPVALTAGTYWLVAAYDGAASVYVSYATTRSTASTPLTLPTSPPTMFGVATFYDYMDLSYYLVVSP